MTIHQTRFQRYVEVIQRANQIAASTELDALLDQMLALIINVTQAQTGTLYLYDPVSDELVFKVVKGDQASQRLVGTRFAAARGVAGAVLRQGEPLFVPDVERDPRWDRSLGELAGVRLKTMYCLPLLSRGRPVGVVQIFNLSATTIDEPDELALLELLCDRLVTEVEKARLLEEAQRRERRQQALVEIIAHITTTLERDHLLELIMNHARDLLSVEATSIWLWDDERQYLTPHLATGERSEQLRRVSVPAGHGIIGYVAQTGETVLVNDVHGDSRFYRQADQQSGFMTRSILCVPLRAPAIQLGGERGEVAATIIGGAQALNKCDRQPFNPEEVALFETLASQAATVIRLSQLYAESAGLFMGIVDAITGAIDLKDPYTRGHSQRVSEFSVAIAHELGLSQEDIYHVRIGSKLHDVGKIGIPDAILSKPDRLTAEEMAEMKSHPLRGAELLMKNPTLHRRMRRELPALAEHHERLDGSGYPAGLRGERISLIGRIVAVADAFDAMTSDRPYRRGMPVERALQILQNGAGAEFDSACVDALVRARAHGAVLVQHEGPPE